MEWYQMCKRRCLTQIWSVALDLVEKGHDVVLELGLVQRADREEFYSRVDGAGVALKIFLLDVAVSERRERVLQRNEEQGPTFKMMVTPEIFEMANSAWQAPDEQEMSERDIEIV